VSILLTAAAWLGKNWPSLATLAIVVLFLFVMVQKSCNPEIDKTTAFVAVIQANEDEHLQALKAQRDTYAEILLQLQKTDRKVDAQLKDAGRRLDEKLQERQTQLQARLEAITAETAVLAANNREALRHEIENLDPADVGRLFDFLTGTSTGSDGD
jgi:F0F1-type ATP synthase membrane subunit b/b'